MPISRLSPRRALALNQGPFPPPALPGFCGTMGLSDTPDGPAWPSRVAGWRSRTSTAGASRVAAGLRVHTCRRHYPDGAAGCFARPVQRRRPSPFLRRVGLRVTRFGACSAFTHVAACMLAESPDATLCTGVLRPLRCLRSRSDCYRLERQLPGGYPLPLKTNAFARRTEISGLAEPDVAEQPRGPQRPQGSDCLYSVSQSRGLTQGCSRRCESPSAFGTFRGKALVDWAGKRPAAAHLEGDRQHGE